MPSIPACNRPWQQAKLTNHGLQFDQANGMQQALLDGFFFVEPSAPIDLAPGDRFARHFYLPPPPNEPRGCAYRGFKTQTETELGPLQGYFCRDADQTEQFFLRSTHWQQLFPQAVCSLAQHLKALAIEVMLAVLKHLDIPRALWLKATGHCMTQAGTHTLTFNHFRPHVKARGLNVHKDSGWVTVLRSLEPGLEVLREGIWCPIDPRPGCFIVNFGCAMEILTRHTARPVAAVAHRVVQQRPEHAKEDRFSYALFLDSSLDKQMCEGLYTYKPEHGLELVADFEQLLTSILDQTYQPHSVGLY